MIEVTVQVFEELEIAQEKLKNMGFEILEKYTMEDSYFSRFDMEEIKILDFATLSKNSVLIRKILNDHPANYFIYKNKSFDENGDVMNEEKVRTKVSEPEIIKEILWNANLCNYANFRTDIYVYKKEDIIFTLQDVENLGLFIEYEEDNTMENLQSEQKRALIISRIKELGLNLGEDFNCKKVYMFLHK